MALPTAAVTGDISAIDGTYYPGGALLTFTLDKPDQDTATNASAPTVPVTVPVGADGQLTVNLWPNERGSFGSRYRVVAQFLDTDIAVASRRVDFGFMYVPEVGGDIADLIAVTGAPDGPVDAATLAQQAAAEAAASETAAAASAAAAASSAASIDGKVNAATAGGIIVDPFFTNTDTGSASFEWTSGNGTVAVKTAAAAGVTISDPANVLELTATGTSGVFLRKSIPGLGLQARDAAMRLRFEGAKFSSTGRVDALVRYTNAAKTGTSFARINGVIPEGATAAAVDLVMPLPTNPLHTIIDQVSLNFVSNAINDRFVITAFSAYLEPQGLGDIRRSVTSWYADRDAVFAAAGDIAEDTVVYAGRPDVAFRKDTGAGVLTGPTGAADFRPIAPFSPEQFGDIDTAANCSLAVRAMFAYLAANEGDSVKADFLRGRTYSLTHLVSGTTLGDTADYLVQFVADKNLTIENNGLVTCAPGITPPSGQASRALFRLEPATLLGDNPVWDIRVVGEGTFECSELPGATFASDIVNIGQGYRDIDVNGLTFDHGTKTPAAGDEYATSYAGGGDSSINFFGGESIHIENCVFIGAPDLGVYANGLNSATETIDTVGRRLSVVNCAFIKCRNAISMKRYFRDTNISGNVIEDGQNGIFDGLSGGSVINSGQRAIVRGNVIRRMRGFAIYLRNSDRCSVIGNEVTDWRREHYDPTISVGSGAQGAITFHGIERGIISDNTIGMETWTRDGVTVSHVAILLDDDTDAVRDTQYVRIGGHVFHDTNRGVQFTAGANNNLFDDDATIFNNVTTPTTDAGTNNVLTSV